LENAVVRADDCDHAFELDPIARHVARGLDAIALTLKQRAAIEDFWQRDRHARPWIYAIERGANR
jgi:3-isopropylmalate dehydratase small subunit